MSDIVTFAPVRALDRNGEAVPGAQARFFRSGTTTPTTVYADVEESIAHPTPLEADSRGIFPPIYRSGQALKVEVRDSMGLLLPGFPVDPAIIVATTGGGASQISFNPTGNIPVNNVQAAIERVQENLVAPLLAGGLGVTGNAPILSDVDATDTPSGFYRFTADSTGTLPNGWASATATGTIWLIRETAATATQFAARRDQTVVWQRRLEAGAWSSWANGPLTLDQATNPASTVFGTVSGQRLAAAVTTAAVLGATAGAASGAVGTYVFAGTTANPGTLNPGTTRAGSALYPAGIRGNTGATFSGNPGRGDHSGHSTSLSGTWRLMGKHTQVNNDPGASLWLRIS